MGYFSELEADVLDMYCAEVPVKDIAEEFDISEELVMRIGRKWEKENLRIPVDI
jgi:DNA-binding Lrp family transcriptional regulator